MPIVHGLEKQFTGRVDFLYLDVSEERTAEVKAKLDFKSTPHIVLLRADGTKTWEHVGVFEEHVLQEALDGLVRG